MAQQIAKACGSFVVLSISSLDDYCGQLHVTHIVVGSALLADGPASLSARQRLMTQLARWPGAVLLDEAWLTQLTSTKRLPPTAGFIVRLGAIEGAAGGRSGSGSSGRGQQQQVRQPVCAQLQGPRQPASLAEGRFERWLGWWSPELDGASEVVVMLQATFNDQRCARVGNSAIVAGLRELKHFELAIRESDDVVGTRALAYARAAAAVQACAFRITGRMSEALLERCLPFVSRSCARNILQLAESAEAAIGRDRGGRGGGDEGGSGEESDDMGPGRAGDEGAQRQEGGGSWAAAAEERDAGGGGGEGAAVAKVTCERLEAFRRDLPVRDGGGALRLGSEGAASRRRLCKLPGVGPSTAKAWYDKGCRTLDDALNLLRSGQLHPPAPVAWALTHHEDLTAEVTPEEVTEMRTAVAEALAAATPHLAAATTAAGGWQVVLVGGGRRGRASHDVDLVISHPAVVEWDEVGRCFDACLARLVEDGRMLPAGGNCTAIQRDVYTHYHQRLMRELAGTAEDGGKRRIEDGLDHIFGVFRTSRGWLKRLDLIFCPAPCLPHAMLGWSGSTQFLRFLHQLADARGLRRTNTGLYRRESRQPVQGIVDEAGIFAALGLPYRAPEDRQCP